MKRLPSMETIIERRMAAGIETAWEFELYYQCNIVDAVYSDETKLELLAELERAKHETVRHTFFSILFAPGIPVAKAKQISAKLNAFVAKEIGYPAHVSDPFAPDAQWLTPSPLKKAAP